MVRAMGQGTYCNWPWLPGAWWRTQYARTLSPARIIECSTRLLHLLQPNHTPLSPDLYSVRNGNERDLTDSCPGKG
jgi:hypothetical protein